MNGVFYVGATGLNAQQRALDVVANNVANMNTTGFKRSEVRFSELVGGWGDVDVSQTVARTQALNGVAMSASARDYSQGEIRQTGKALDLAINGPGFIELIGPDGGDLLWRGGSLSIDRDGLLTGPGGLPLKAMIATPQDATAITIGQDGKVTATVDGRIETLGRIEIALAKDAGALSFVGDGLYRSDGPADVLVSQAGEDGAGLLVQGSLEGANVELSNEMVNLLLLQRSYAANAQVVQAGDQLMAIANGLKR